VEQLGRAVVVSQDQHTSGLSNNQMQLGVALLTHQANHTLHAPATAQMGFVLVRIGAVICSTQPALAEHLVQENASVSINTPMQQLLNMVQSLAVMQ